MLFRPELDVMSTSSGSLPGPDTTRRGASQALVDALKEGNVALKDANTALREVVASLQNERRLLINKNDELKAKGEGPWTRTTTMSHWSGPAARPAKLGPRRGSQRSRKKSTSELPIG